MLRLNASVHSWLTRQERKLQAAMLEQAAEKLQQQGQAIAADSTNESEQQEKQQAEMGSKMESTIITVTDTNGNQLESYTTKGLVRDAGITVMTASTATNTSALSEKHWDLDSLRSSETEFHRHLKDEVSDMYTAWDQADERFVYFFFINKIYFNFFFFLLFFCI